LKNPKVLHWLGGALHLMKHTLNVHSLAMSTGGRWNNLPDNINSLKIALTNSSGQSTGTFSGRFIVYALNAR